jgi:hypothetical protein
MTDPDRGIEGRPSRALWFAVGLALVVAIVVTLYAASGGVRGSDQYWYLTDTEALARDHVLTSNTVFPVALLGPDPTIPPPFIHNVLSVYLAAVPAIVVGAFDGWLVLGLLSTFGAAGLIFLAARTVAPRWPSILVAVTYPLLPIAVWHSAQPLAEASTALFAALAMYALSVAGRATVRWFLLLLALGLLYLSRESYLPLLLVAPIGFLLVRAGGGKGSWRPAIPPAIGLGVVALAIVVISQSVVPADNVRFSYGRLLHSAVPGSTSNMFFNFDLSPANLADRLPFDGSLLLAKLGGHLAEQFVTFDSPAFAAFYWGFNLLVLIALVMLWRFRRQDPQRIVIVGALGFAAIHFATLVLFQNQARYLLPAIPGLLVVLAVALASIDAVARPLARHVVPAILGLTLVLGAADVVLARTLRSDAVATGESQQAVSAMLDRHVRADEPLLVVYAGTPQMIAYAARPRLVLYSAPEYDSSDYARLRAALPAGWLLAPVPPDGSAPVGAAGQPTEQVEALGTTWGLYRLPD